MNIADFQELIWQKGHELYREMPWRTDTRPYFVLVSELMLQQTQVERVVPKFRQFMTMFPTVNDLAEASLADVLTAWSGLGYNRRAKFLHEAAKTVSIRHEGEVPASYDELVALPGVGPNTAGAILAYSFNRPVVFVETNIRTVFFHHFFADQQGVSDALVREKVAATMDREHPREWYWALMDYGSFLKRSGAGRLDQSRHYKKQSPLKGSLREVRGMILKQLTNGDMTQEKLRVAMPADERYERALGALVKEGLVGRRGDTLHLRR